MQSYFLKLPRLLWYFFVVLTAKKIWSKDRSPCGKKKAQVTLKNDAVAILRGHFDYKVSTEENLI